MSAPALVPELVVLLDEDGHAIGTTAKAGVHHSDTPLHLAFSCYLFNDRGELLLTQRALSKPTWPGAWTNSVCGHPVRARTPSTPYAVGCWPRSGSGPRTSGCCCPDSATGR